jgi:selenocysteine-specific elongation factor
MLLREPGSRRIIGGVAVDVLPPVVRGRADRAARSEELATMTGVPDLRAEVRRRKVVHTATLRAIGVPAGSLGDSEWLMDEPHQAMLRARLVEFVTNHAAKYPLEMGVSIEAARQLCELPDLQLVRRLVGSPLELRDGKVAIEGASALPESLRAPFGRLEGRLRAAPFDAPDAESLEALGLDRTALSALVQRGMLISVSHGVYLLSDAEEQAMALLSALKQPFTASDARQALSTTRRVAIPLLEHLDRKGLTRRVDAEGRRVTASTLR